MPRLSLALAAWVMAMAPALAPTLADEDCVSRLNAEGQVVSSCGGADLMPQMTPPGKREMERELGDGPTITVHDPEGLYEPQDCDPAAGTCPQGLDDGMSDGGLLGGTLMEGAGDGEDGVTTSY